MNSSYTGSKRLKKERSITSNEGFSDFYNMSGKSEVTNQLSKPREIIEKIKPKFSKSIPNQASEKDDEDPSEKHKTPPAPGEEDKKQSESKSVSALFDDDYEGFGD